MVTNSPWVKCLGSLGKLQPHSLSCPLSLCRCRVVNNVALDCFWGIAYSHSLTGCSFCNCLLDLIYKVGYCFSKVFQMWEVLRDAVSSCDPGELKSSWLTVPFYISLVDVLLSLCSGIMALKELRLYINTLNLSGALYLNKPLLNPVLYLCGH